MIVLSYGILKSGSTLAFELCKSVLQERGFEQRRLPDGVVVEGHHINFLETISISGLQKVLAEVAPHEWIALKTHAPLDPREKDFVLDCISRGLMKVHVNFRDPREICLSLLDAGVHARTKGRQAFSEIRTLADAARITSRQLANCRVWGSLPGTLLLFYNDVAFDVRRVIDQMCTEFKLTKYSAEEKQRTMDRVDQAFTQKNKAVKDRHKTELTPTESRDLLHQIADGFSFVEQVCENRDYNWFRFSEKE